MSEENKKQNDIDNSDEIITDSDDLDISFDDTSGDNQDKVNKIKHKLNQALKEKEEYLSGWQRCRADFVNAKRMADIDRLGLADSISESLIKDILPVLDSFDLALANKNQVEESWRTGFLGIYSKMLDILGKRGLKQVGLVGDKFNVNEQEPVATTSVDKEDLDDIVTEVLQRGYSLNGKIIRPAKVIIGQYKKV